MDHYLDYVFTCAILIGYSFIIPDKFFNMYFFVLAVLSAFMINSFLSFAATNQFRITYFGIGPTEIRLLFIIINTLLIIFGKTYIGPALPVVLAAAWICLNIVVYRTQKELWQNDIATKH